MLLIAVLGLVLVTACSADVRSWTDEDGVEVEIIRKIPDGRCKIKSDVGDTIEQWYKLTGKDGRVIGSNFNGKPYKFVLGRGQVIRGMDSAMMHMCVGEQRRVVIPPQEELDEEDRDDIQPGATLYYFVELVSLFRPNPGDKWLDDDGLSIEVTHKIEDEECRKAEPGDLVKLDYAVHLEDGSFVGSSEASNRPLEFELSRGKVIPGMDRAVFGMCENERRKVVIPPELAYGEKGRPPTIPAQSYLVFEVHLTKLTKADDSQQSEKEEL